MSKKLGQKAQKPVDTWYQWKPIPTEFKKDNNAQLKKGDTWTLKFSGAWEKTSEEGYTFVTYFFDTADGKRIALPKCDKLKDIIDEAGKKWFSLTYLGKGKPKPGRRPPYLFDAELAQGPKSTSDEVADEPTEDEEYVGETESDSDPEEVAF